MNVDISIKVQVELFQDRNEGLDVIIGRLARSNGEVTLEEYFFLRDVSDHQAV